MIATTLKQRVLTSCLTLCVLGGATVGFMKLNIKAYSESPIGEMPVLILLAPLLIELCSRRMMWDGGELGALAKPAE